MMANTHVNCLLTGEVPCHIGGKCITESDLCDECSYKIVY